MPRSTYIYTVRTRSEHVVACFTVKREMLRWLELELAASPDARGSLFVASYRDGRSTDARDLGDAVAYLERNR